jgi:hypothetical protein
MPEQRIQPKTAFINPVNPPAPGQRTEGGQWADLCKTPLVRRAFEVALAEYVVKLVVEPGMPGGAAFKMQGAREVLNVLLNLGEEQGVVRRGAREDELDPV